MKKNICCFVIFICAFSCDAQFILKGKFLNKPNLAYLYIYKLNNISSNGEIIDSISINNKDGFTYYLDSLQSTISLYLISIANESNNGFEFPGNAYIFNNTGKVLSLTIASEQQIWNVSLKECSPENEFLFSLQQKIWPYFGLVDDFLKYEDTEFKSKVREKLILFQHSISDSFYNVLSNVNRKSSTNLLSALYFYSIANAAKVEKISQPFIIKSSDLPQNALSASLLKMLEIVFDKKAVESAILSGNFFDDHLNKINFTKPGNLLVIDVWASWCGACRKANKESVPAFIERIQKKNVDFVSISIDVDSAKWMKASVEDKIIWRNMLFVSGGETPLPAFVQDNGIPLLFVMNNKGEIIYTANNMEDIEQYIKALD